jgi:hypothetical protein
MSNLDGGSNGGRGVSTAVKPSDRLLVGWWMLALLLVGLPASSAQAALTSREAAGIAAKQAEQLGTIESAEVVRSSSTDAQALLSPEVVPAQAASSSSRSPAAGPGAFAADLDEPGQTEGGAPIAVEVVALRGQFTDTLAKEPRGMPAPSGTVMTFTIDDEGTVHEVGVGDSAPNLKQLGSVAIVAVSGATATIARARSAKRSSKRPRARAATWGEHCSQGEGHHCFGLAEWVMSGSEQVEGAGVVIDTTAGDVPGWASGDFFDHELWASFPAAKEWVEIGQEAGSYRSCCTMYPFFAWKNSGGYKASMGYGGIAMNQWNPYTVKSAGGNIWCFYFPGNWQVGCVGGFPSNYATELQVGVEIGANTEPPNAGIDEANYSAVGGAVRVWNRAEYWSNPKICLSYFQPGGRAPIAGDVNFGTC